MSMARRQSIESRSLSFSGVEESLPHDLYHHFHIHCLATKKILQGKFYRTAAELRRDVFLLFDRASFNETNALLTYADAEGKEVALIDAVPAPLPKDQYRHLFIRFIHPVCAMCSGSFGILDDQVVFQCPRETCGEQYCGSCVRAIQGDAKPWPLICLSCRKHVEPQRHALLETHLIWSNMRLLYGTGNLEALMQKSNFLSIEPLKRDIEFRQIHLLCHLDTLRHTPCEQLITDVEQLCQDLQSIHDEATNIDSNFRLEQVDIHQIAHEHKKITKDADHLCEKLTFLIEQLQSQTTISLRNSDEHEREDVQRSFVENRLVRLSVDQNVESIDRNLLDVSARKQLLDYQLYTLQNLLSKDTLASNADIEKLLQKGRQRIEEFDKFLDQLNIVRRTLRAIERHAEKYVALLTDERYPEIVGSRFIYSMEKLRREMERADLAKNFPQLTELMNVWQSDRGIDENFKPKVLTMCQTIEKDLQNLLSDRRSVYSVPFRVGVVGHTSVGKSALVIALSGYTQFSSMISLQRSTFGYLRFDTSIEDKRPNGRSIPLSFIDIAGATDGNTSKSMGDYLELITNADCDLYLMVFDRLFDAQNQIWFEYIENTLARKCLLIRSKADLAFDAFHKTMAGKKFEKSTSTFYDIRCTIEKIRQHAKTKWNEKHLEQRIFLTATGDANELGEEPFGQFDFDHLRRHIHSLARRELRIARVCRLAVLSANTMINTCFRRAYVVSQTKYRWLAAGTSIVPFLDEIPVYFGSEEIRQAFGIHDRLGISNSLQRTKNSLEEYLRSHQLAVPKETFKSSCFQYLVSNEVAANHASTTYSRGSEKMNVIGRLFRDILRIATPTASTVFGIASFAGFVISAALTPLAVHWSYYSSGERMHQHLNLLCDDLQILMNHLIINLCHRYGSEQSPPSSSSSASSSSSSDEDNS